MGTVARYEEIAACWANRSSFVRAAEDRLAAYYAAYYDVCRHSGYEFTEGCGRAWRFVCRFHGWAWDLDGNNVRALAREVWEGARTDDNLRMKQVRVEAWRG